MMCSCQQKPSSPETDASTTSIPVSTAEGDKPDVSTEKKDLFDDGNFSLFLFFLSVATMPAHVLELVLLIVLLLSAVLLTCKKETLSTQTVL